MSTIPVLFWFRGKILLLSNFGDYENPQLSLFRVFEAGLCQNSVQRLLSSTYLSMILHIDELFEGSKFELQIFYIFKPGTIS